MFFFCRLQNVQYLARGSSCRALCGTCVRVPVMCGSRFEVITKKRTRIQTRRHQTELKRADWGRIYFIHVNAVYWHGTRYSIQKRESSLSFLIAFLLQFFAEHRLSGNARDMQIMSIIYRYFHIPPSPKSENGSDGKYSVPKIHCITIERQYCFC